jgi:hypothetical protein
MVFNIEPKRKPLEGATAELILFVFLCIPFFALKAEDLERNDLTQARPVRVFLKLTE